MKNIDIKAFSDYYKVRRLTGDDASEVLELMQDNRIYCRHCGAEPSLESVLRDMSLLPPGKGPEDKYYLGYFEYGYLVAVLDFIDGYPDADTAYIGLFMLSECIQGKGIGTALVEKLCLCCEEWGFKRVLLGYEKNNPQSSSFWQKNRFVPLREVRHEQGLIVEAERRLEGEKPAAFESFLKSQLILHPAFGARDALKMCYQAAYGSEHGTANAAAARKYLREELKAVEPRSEGALYEKISPTLCRVNLAVWKGKGLPWQWLYNIFAAAEGDGDMEEKLKAVAALAAKGRMRGYSASDLSPVSGFTAEDWEKELAAWDGGPVSHSDGYREGEKPAYRIAPLRYMEAVPVLEEMAGRPEGCVVAIDGMSNSGKSSLADMIVKITGAGIVRTDDFLQPAGRMTVVNKGMPGGNICYDIIKRDVLPCLGSGEGFRHPYFEGHLISKKRRYVRKSPYRVVEGSYSQHPYFGDYADIKVFVHTDKATQRRRVLLRDGDKLAPSYFRVWIPMEDEYFHYFSLKEKADVVVET